MTKWFVLYTLNFKWQIYWIFCFFSLWYSVNSVFMTDVNTLEICFRLILSWQLSCTCKLHINISLRVSRLNITFNTSLCNSRRNLLWYRVKCNIIVAARNDKVVFWRNTSTLFAFTKIAMEDRRFPFVLYSV